MRVRVGVFGVFVLLLIAVSAVTSAAMAAPHGLSKAGDGASLSAREATGPGLLTMPWSSSFAVRPATFYIAGEGSSLVGHLPGKGGSIRWAYWAAHRARGVGTYWLDDFNPNAAEGTFHPHRAVITASRVRSGHFTRLTIRFHGGSKVWNRGRRLYVQHFRLTRMASSGYAW